MANKGPNKAARFTSALPVTTTTTTSTRGGAHHLPQAIAHRGFKAQYPENTLLAFRTALDEAGAHALETDLHLSRDGVVVLSHDGTLKRCFGIEDKKINECDWDYLKTLETVREPRQRMPRLEDLLGLLAEEGRGGGWVLLDIKVRIAVPGAFELVCLWFGVLVLKVVRRGRGAGRRRWKMLT